MKNAYFEEQLRTVASVSLNFTKSFSYLQNSGHKLLNYCRTQTRRHIKYNIFNLFINGLPSALVTIKQVIKVQRPISLMLIHCLSQLTLHFFLLQQELQTINWYFRKLMPRLEFGSKYKKTLKSLYSINKESSWKSLNFIFKRNKIEPLTNTLTYAFEILTNKSKRVWFPTQKCSTNQK